MTNVQKIRRAGLSMLIAGLLTASTASAATTFTWALSANGNWSSGTSWGGTAPTINGVDTILVFGRNTNAYNASDDMTTGSLGNNDVFHLVGMTFSNSGTAVNKNYNIQRTNNRTLSFDADTSLNNPFLHLDATTGNFTLLIPSALSNSLDISGNGTGTFEISGVLSGAGGINKSGSSTLTLSGLNVYTGATNITGGKIILTQASGIANGNNVFIDTGAILDINSKAQTFDQLAGSGTLMTGGATLTVGSAGGSSNWAGVISENGGLIKTGAGIFTILNTQSFTGNLTINGGTLRLSTGGGFSGSPNTTVTSPGVLDLNNVSTSIGSLTGTGNVTLGSGTLTLNGGAAYSGVISGSGGLTLTSGTETLSGANTFTGQINVMSGANLSFASASNRLSNVVDVNVDGMFDLKGFDQTIDALTGSSTGTVQNAGTLVVGNNNGSGAFAGKVHGGMNLTKVGSGTQTLSRVDSDYTGTTNINGGVLSITTLTNGGANSSIGKASNAAANITFDGGTLQYTGATVATNRSFTVNNGGAGIDVSSAATTLTISGVATAGSGTGGLTKYGAGTLVLSNTNTYTGNTLVKLGLLNVTGSLLNNGSNKVFIDADTDGSFSTGTDTKLSRSILNNGSYAGYGSSITSSLFTHADILGGTNTSGSTKSLGMQWRTIDSTAGEINSTYLISDVVRITGIDGTKFVLQMNYDDFAGENTLAAAGLLYLAWLDTSDNTWKNAIDGNHGANVGLTNVQGSWAGAGGSTLALGSWGVDTSANVVWAVLDHNSQFAVLAPAPGAAAAGSVLMLMMAARRRRRR